MGGGDIISSLFGRVDTFFKRQLEVAEEAKDR